MSDYKFYKKNIQIMSIIIIRWLIVAYGCYLLVVNNGYLIYLKIHGWALQEINLR